MAAIATVPAAVQDRQVPPSYLSNPTDARCNEIKNACRDRQLATLREFASAKGGFVHDDLRRLAWPILLGIDPTDALSYATVERDDRPKHGDEEQVHLDVDRSFVYYPADETDTKRQQRKDELASVIVTVLRHHPTLHYFQGYHDIAQVVLLALGAQLALPVVARLSLLRIRDFMLPTMAGTEPHLRLLPVVLHVADPGLARLLSQTQPFFALASTLTLYAHDIEDYADIARLFDFLLASEAAMPIYLFVAIVLSRKKELEQIDPDEPEMLHFTLSKLPRPLELDGLISSAVALFRRHPPDKLPGRIWSHISPNSVLKTTRDLDNLTLQTFQDGERYLANEAEEIRRHEARVQKQRQLLALARHYRSPALWTGGALLLAIIAVVMRSTAPQLSTSHFAGLAGWRPALAEMWSKLATWR